MAAVAAVLLPLAPHAVHDRVSMAELRSVLMPASNSRCSGGSEVRITGSCGQAYCRRRTPTSRTVTGREALRTWSWSQRSDS